MDTEAGGMEGTGNCHTCCVSRALSGTMTASGLRLSSEICQETEQQWSRTMGEHWARVLEGVPVRLMLERSW